MNLFKYLLKNNQFSIPHELKKKKISMLSIIKFDMKPPVNTL